MKEIDKVRVILPHWITHNREHGAEFTRWADTLEKDGHAEVADALRKAVEAAEDVTAKLKKALELAGGPMEASSDHSHVHARSHLHTHGHDHSHHHGHHDDHHKH